MVVKGACVALPLTTDSLAITCRLLWIFGLPFSINAFSIWVEYEREKCKANVVTRT